MKRLVLLAAALATTAAEAGLEIPSPGSVQSGIGLVMGWDCTASQVQVRIDGFPVLPAAAHMPRGDTAGACGRTDTGYALLFNYNTLSIGPHSVIVSDGNGRVLGTVSFSVTHAGVEFMTGKSQAVEIPNFPAPGDRTHVAWSEEKQDFSIVSIERSGFAGPRAQYYNGKYYGAALDIVVDAFHCGPTPIPNPRAEYPAIFKVRVDDASVTLEANLADGRTCTASGPISSSSDFAWSSNTNTISAVLQSSCRQFNDMSVQVDGERLTGSGRSDCATYTVRAIGF
jgi:hypothetical protein